MALNSAAIQSLIHYVKTDVWRVRLNEIPRRKAVAVRSLRVLILSITGFIKDNCALRASALTFYSLLSLVPVAALAFGIAKGFGFEKLLQRQLMERFPGQEEVVTQVISFSQSMLANTRGGVIAGIGICILLWTVLKVLSNIEHSFNTIWGISTHRTPVRKFSDYLSITFTAPVLVIVSGSATVFITTQLTLISSRLDFLGFISPVIFAFIKLVPYCLIWLLFTFVYMVLPNTRVRFSSGLIGGIIGGTSYQIAQWLYINFQIGTARYNAVYGSFAAVPLLIIWMQISWLIVLFGSEISYAHQNADSHEYEPEFQHISPLLWKLLILQVAHRMVTRFVAGKPADTAEGVSDALEIPRRLVDDILNTLVNCGLFSRVQSTDNGPPAFQPARDSDFFTVTNVLDAVETEGADRLWEERTPEFIKLSEILSKFRQLIADSPDNRYLRDI